MRFMLHENNLAFINMHKEIEYLRNYIALQKLRTQSSPDIIIEDNITEQNCDYTIAPMLLIPLVENAFKHGISLKERSWIKINLECTATSIVFKVRNSMHEKTNSNDLGLNCPWLHLPSGNGSASQNPPGIFWPQSLGRGLYSRSLRIVRKH